MNIIDDTRAITLFKEIQSRPYSLSAQPGEPSNNCYFKGIELLQKLGIMGYTVRGRVGETYWNPAIFGEAITQLLPADILTTHFYCEIYQNGQWRIIDPSFQPSLAPSGLTIGSWDGGESCFPITKLYTQAESLAYQEQWFDSAYQDDFFTRGGACWAALSQWFKHYESST